MEHESAPLVEEDNHLIAPKRVKRPSKAAQLEPEAEKAKKKPRYEKHHMTEARLNALERARQKRKENLQKKLEEKKKQEEAEIAPNLLEKPDSAIEQPESKEEREAAVEPIEEKKIDDHAQATHADLIPIAESLEPGQSTGEAREDRLLPRLLVDFQYPDEEYLYYKGAREERIVKLLKHPTTSVNKYKILPVQRSPFEYREDEIQQNLSMIPKREKTAEQIQRNFHLEQAKYESMLGRQDQRQYIQATEVRAPTVDPAPAVSSYSRSLFSGNPSYIRETNYSTGFNAVPPEIYDQL